MFQWVEREPTPTVAYWDKAQQAGPTDSLWPPHGARGSANVREPRAQRAVTAASAHGVVRGSTAQWRLIDDKVFTSTIPIAPAMSRYTET
jgi:hypothetical protein